MTIFSYIIPAFGKEEVSNSGECNEKLLTFCTIGSENMRIVSKCEQKQSQKIAHFL